jgi:hypothetical protein
MPNENEGTKEVLADDPAARSFRHGESVHRYYDTAEDIRGITAAQHQAEQSRPGPIRMPASFIGAPGTARLRAAHEIPADAKVLPALSSQESVHGSRFQRERGAK